MWLTLGLQSQRKLVFRPLCVIDTRVLYVALWAYLLILFANCPLWHSVHYGAGEDSRSEDMKPIDGSANCNQSTDELTSRNRSNDRWNVTRF
ncbi:hypothetical protein DPMN_031261 [Dreissena polymorpha]|uniref:Uncharacterized protein n=1 Tax=Dreissena polymorpha TaxID=45954 RepID=A0A9D4M2Q9_DREPO|nr:hypothetical protein DPMN_031261 [Dreissena polymorpha]